TVVVSEWVSAKIRPCHHLRDRELRMIGSDTVDVGVLKSAVLRFCVCSSNWRCKTMPATRTCRATAARLSRRPGLSLLATIEPVSERTPSKASLEVTNSRGLLEMRPARCFSVHCAKLHRLPAALSLGLFRSEVRQNSMAWPDQAYSKPNGALTGSISPFVPRIGTCPRKWMGSPSQNHAKGPGWSSSCQWENVIGNSAARCPANGTQGSTVDFVDLNRQ